MIARATPRPGMGDESEHFTEANGYMTGRTAALADWHFRRDQNDFAKLCQRLLARRWYIANASRILDELRQRRHAAAMAQAGRVITCQGCAVLFCRVPTEGGNRRGPQPGFCTMKCYFDRWYARQAELLRKARAAQALVCVACGEPITKRPKRGPLPRFCSVLCQGRDAKRRREERAAQVAA